MKPSPRSFVPLLAAVILAGQSTAATVTKSPTGTDLNDGASWGGTAPAATDTATWTGTSLGAGLTLGLPASWQGATVTGALSNIDVSGAGQLTLGTAGLEMSNSTVNATLNIPVDLTANQSWKVGAGRTLTASGAISS